MKKIIIILLCAIQLSLYHTHAMAMASRCLDQYTMFMHKNILQTNIIAISGTQNQPIPFDTEENKLSDYLKQLQNNASHSFAQTTIFAYEEKGGIKKFTKKGSISHLSEKDQLTIADNNWVYLFPYGINNNKKIFGALILGTQDRINAFELYNAQNNDTIKQIQQVLTLKKNKQKIQ